MNAGLILGLEFGAYLIGLAIAFTRVLNHALNDQFEKLEKRVKKLEKQAKGGKNERTPRV